MADMQKVQETVHALVLEGFDHTFGTPEVTLPENDEWKKLDAIGTQLWLDTGDLEVAKKQLTAEFNALTTNNTLLNNEVQKGIYDDLVGKAAKAIREAAPDITEQDLVLEIAFVLNAFHGLRLVKTFDAFVSVELHTDLSLDVERSVAYGERYFAICPDRFIIKVPLTPAGYLAAGQLAANGIPINFTLGFSARQNYVAALLTNPRWVNVFMGRLGAFVADHHLGSGENVGEKATLATQRALIALRKAGRSKTHLIGASMRSGVQVGSLAGLDVYTMPPKVARQYLENPLPELTSHVEDDPEVTLADGVSLADFNGATLWEVSDDFKTCVDALLKKGASSLTPEAIQEHFAAAGFGDFLPYWSDADIATADRDGKIPVFETWKERLQSGEIGLDALMNLSALRSFTTDQTAFDNRVRSLL